VVPQLLVLVGACVLAAQAKGCDVGGRVLVVKEALQDQSRLNFKVSVKNPLLVRLMGA